MTLEGSAIANYLSKTQIKKEIKIKINKIHVTNISASYLLFAFQFEHATKLSTKKLEIHLL